MVAKAGVGRGGRSRSTRPVKFGRGGPRAQARVQRTAQEHDERRARHDRHRVAVATCLTPTTLRRTTSVRRSCVGTRGAEYLFLGARSRKYMVSDIVHALVLSPMVSSLHVLPCVAVAACEMLAPPRSQHALHGRGTITPSAEQVPWTHSGCSCFSRPSTSGSAGPPAVLGDVCGADGCEQPRRRRNGDYTRHGGHSGPRH